MDASERDEIPMLSAAYFQSDDPSSSTSREFGIRMRSASMFIPTNSLDSSENEHNLVGFTGPLRNERQTPLVQMSGPLFANRNREPIFQPPQGALRQKTTDPKIERYSSIDRTENKDWQMDDYAGKNEHLLRSGQLGMCNDPYCTTCPTFYNVNGGQKQSRTSDIFDAKFHNMIHGDAKGWAKRMCSFLHPYIPGIMNPHTKVVQMWNKFFVISCLFSVFLDPLFFFLLSVQEDNKCLVLNWPLTTAIVVLRSMTDFIYLLHILLQFRLAYVAPESRVAGSGDLVDDPKKIARHYLFGYFFIDCFVVLPLPQIIILLISPDSMGKNLLRAAILVQYIPRLYRFLPLLANRFIFESAWANSVINLLTFVLAGHVVGSCWYLFGLQRVNQCFRDACHESKSSIPRCMEFIDCGHGDDYRSFRNDLTWEDWKKNENATACFGEGHFDFGIYKTAVNLTTHKSIVTRYVYSLFWGLQQISTLAGNQVPSYFVWEVLFTIAITVVGLLLFAVLIGNMQSFLLSLGRRRLEWSSRRRDVEQWMRHRRLPEELRSQVQASEWYNWVVTRGVNEEMLMENLPEDLQREIRRHLFFVEKVQIFQGLDKRIMDAVYERLRTKKYMVGSIILCRGGLVDKMVFIIRGKMESIGGDGIGVSLSEGDVCGEELLTWCLEHSSVNKDGRRIRIPGHRLLSNRDVKCMTYVEAFVLRAADLEEVTSRMEGDKMDTSKLETNDVSFGRGKNEHLGKNEHFWTDEESWVLIRCLQDMAIDPLWKTNGGFKNNYMSEIKRIMVQKLPNFTKEVKHIKSRIKFLKNKFHAISDMCKQSGCSWNDVEQKIACERPWFDEWVKSHKDAKGLYNVSFPYLSDLEVVYGKDRAARVIAEDPIAAAENITNEVEVDLSVTDDSATNDNELEASTGSNKKNKLTSNKVRKNSKKPKTMHVQNVEYDFKVLSDRVEGFMKDVSSHFESMSAWVQGRSSKMPQVLEELGKHGFSGKDKFKIAQAICEDAVKVELLFSLDDSEVRDYVLSFL